MPSDLDDFLNRRRDEKQKQADQAARTAEAKRKVQDAKAAAAARWPTVHQMLVDAITKLNEELKKEGVRLELMPSHSAYEGLAQISVRVHDDGQIRKDSLFLSVTSEGIIYPDFRPGRSSGQENYIPPISLDTVTPTALRGLLVRFLQHSVS